MDKGVLALLVFSIAAAAALLWDSISNSRDIPAGWASLIALVWGSVLGLRKGILRLLDKKLPDKDEKKGGTSDEP